MAEAILVRHQAASLDRTRAIVLSGLIAVLVAVGWHGVGLGLGHDLDSRAMFENSVPAILHGSYAPGRSFGNPLYEYIAAWLYAAGGIVLANSYSVVLAIGTVLVFDCLLQGTSPARRTLALVGLALNPVFLSNASCFAEWMQMFFLVTCLLWSSYRWLESPRPLYLIAYGFSCSLLVLTRPDGGVLCLAVFLALLWQINFDRRRSLSLIAASATAGLITIAIFIVLNGGFSFVNNLTSDHNDNWPRRFIIATLGVFTIFGPIGLAVLGVCVASLIGRRRGGGRLSFWARLFLIASVVGFARYVPFPQKLEYIFYLVPISLLWLAHDRFRLTAPVLLTASLILPTFVALSLFERRTNEDHLSFEPRLNASAVVQDWVTIKADWDVMNAGFLRAVAAEVYAGEAGPPPGLYTTNFGPGIQSDQGDLIIGATEAYRLDNPRSGSEYQRRLYRRIYICDKSVFHGGAGWRFLEPPVSRLTADPQTGRVAVSCTLETSRDTRGEAPKSP